MPSIEIKMTGLAEEVAILSNARTAWYKEMKRALATIGEDAKTTIIKRFREGGTTATRTAVRTGQLRRSYGSRVRVWDNAINLDVGVIRASGEGVHATRGGLRSGQIPLHARVHEGYDAHGNRVDMFVIRPRDPNGFLYFPIRTGGTAAHRMVSQAGARWYLGEKRIKQLLSGGMAQRNILGWVFAKEVHLRPRPSLPYIEQKTPPVIEKAGADVFVKVATGA